MHWILQVIAFPLLEEIVFRWGIQRGIEKRMATWRGIPSNAITSLLFALAHVPAWGWFYGALVVPPSLIFGFVYQKSGRLFFCVALHAGFNFIGNMLNVAGLLVAWFNSVDFRM